MKFIIPIIVGGIIGYATNWLAIKMLFRPYDEKKIMGIKVPFTPGLIPKEKNRIAVNIGETVGEHLLSPKVISEELLSEKANIKIKNLIKSKIDKLEDEEKSIQDLLITLPKNTQNEIIFTMDNLSKDVIIRLIRSKNTQNEILNFIKNKLYDDKIYDKLNKEIKDLLRNTMKSEKLENLIQNKIEGEIQRKSEDESILIDILPKNIEITIDKYLEDNIDKIGNQIRDMLKSPVVEKQLKSSISSIIDQKLSRLITSFIPAESIAEKIYLAIDKYINNEDSNKDILLIIKLLVNRLMKSNVSELTPDILDIINSKDLSKYIITYLGSEENQDIIVNIIDDRVREIDREELITNLSKQLNILLSSKELEDQIFLFIDNSIVDFMKKPIGDIFRIIEGSFSNIYDLLKNIFDEILIKSLPSIIKLFNVSEIVEAEINKFDVKFTEKLILDIASKELRAITWLGGLLGGVIGFLSILLQIL